jgi:hypothetical protein
MADTIGTSTEPHEGTGVADGLHPGGVPNESRQSGGSIFEDGFEFAGDEHPSDGTDKRQQSDAGGFTDPETGADSDAPFGRTPTGRARKRPVGSGGRSGATGNTGGRATARETTQATADIATMLYLAHMAISKVIKVEELELTPDESQMLADATVRVSQQYDVKVLDPKTMAWIGLILVCAQVYGPRVVAVVNNKKSKAKRPQPSNVTFMGTAPVNNYAV